MKHTFIVSLFLTACTSMFADTLTVHQAISLALEQSYAIKIAKNEAQSAEVNTGYAAAGMLPIISASAGQVGGVNTINQSLLSGQEIIRESAGNSGTNLGIALNWTLFDGFGMFASYDRLQALKEVGELRLRSSMQQTIGSVLRAYCAMVRNQLLIRAAIERVDLSREGLRLASLRYSVGRSGEQEQLQASVELHADSTALMRLQDQLRQSRLQLNNAIGGHKDTLYVVSMEFPSFDITNEILNGNLIQQQNPELMAVKAGTIAADAMLKQMEARAYPRLSLNSEYNFNQASNDGSFVTSSRVRGASFALTAQYSLLDGFRLGQQIESANIEKQNTELQTAQILDNLMASHAIAKGAYHTGTSIVTLQEQNILLAEKNANIALERYKQGALSNFDFRISAQSIFDARSTLAQARFEKAISSLDLLLLTGTLQDILKK
ncbi:MAG: TolC family protein [Ignavibacteria bacterium]